MVTETEQQADALQEMHKSSQLLKSENTALSARLCEMRRVLSSLQLSWVMDHVPFEGSDARMACFSVPQIAEATEPHPIPMPIGKTHMDGVLERLPSHSTTSWQSARSWMEDATQDRNGNGPTHPAGLQSVHTQDPVDRVSTFYGPSTVLSTRRKTICQRIEKYVLTCMCAGSYWHASSRTSGGRATACSVGE